MFVYIRLQKPNFPVTSQEALDFFKMFNTNSNSLTDIAVFVCKCVTDWKRAK